jgi:hypothetical protein
MPGATHGRVGRIEDRSMDNERPRPRGAAGSISAAAEHDREPQQLVLWSAAQENGAPKSAPRREAAQTAASKFLLIEPIVASARAASARDHAIRADDEIRPPRRDEFAIPEPTTPAQWLQLALLSGALMVGLCLGWIGGSMSSRFFAAPPAAAQRADASICAREGACAAAKSDREAMASAATTKIAGTRAGIVNRERAASSGTQQASAAANRDVATTNSISMQERANLRPAAAPETRPTTIEGWAIREVVGGTVVLQGPSGVWRVTQGDTVPGVGRIDSIVRWGSRWIVATTRGLISTVD